MTDDLSLDDRSGLPEALRVLLADYPRDAWQADPNFSALIKFWLDRHLMFRRILAMMTDATETVLEGDQDPQRFASVLSRLGGQFVQELHGHHMIEDTHYFPHLKTLDTRLERGFDILDRDHHAIDGHLNAFVETANTTLRGLAEPAMTVKDTAAPMAPALTDLTRFLDRHLVDEEELVVPVLLKYAPAGMA